MECRKLPEEPDSGHGWPRELLEIDNGEFGDRRGGFGEHGCGGEDTRLRNPNPKEQTERALWEKEGFW